MERSKFKRFKGFIRLRRGTRALGAAVLCLAFVAACETARKSTHPAVFTESPLDCRAELSRLSAYNGSIVGVQAWITGEIANAQEAQISGSFNGKDFLFFPLQKTNESGLRFGALVPVPYLLAEEADFKKNPEKRIQIECRAGQWKKELIQQLRITEGPYGFEVLKDLPKSRIKALSTEDLARVAREAKELSEIYARVTAERLWDGLFFPPIEIPRFKRSANVPQSWSSKDILDELDRMEQGSKKWVTSTFGKKRLLRAKGAKKLKFKSFHSGLDLRAQTPIPVIAPAAGRVVLTKDLFYTGNTVAIDHGYGLVTLYAHLSEFKVKVGDPVRLGQEIALSGGTGRVTGPHLHWQAMLNHERVNPVDLFALSEAFSTPDAGK